MRPIKSVRALVAAALLSVSMSTGAAALDSNPASDLRILLDRLLSEHAFLTVQALYAGVADSEQFAAAADALESNTQELQEAFASVYGDEAGQRFGDLWRAHIGYVVDYTRAHQAGDEEAEQEALDGVATYQADFAEFLAGANPHLTEDTVHALLEDHLAQLQQVANITAGDHEAVYATAHEAYHHMFVLGDGLAEAIVAQFPDRFPGRTYAFGPAIDLRIDLDRLLGEHAFLAAEVMRQGETGEDAERAAADALAANGDAIRTTIADIYGEDAGDAFADMWAQHNGHYVDYVRALQDGDTDAAERASENLEDFSDQVADFFAAAADLADGEAVRAGLAAHTSHLLEQVEAQEAGEYVEAFAIAREAYRHMGAISDLLATGVANQFPERFLPDTAVAPRAGLDPVWALAGLVLLIGALAVPWHRRLARDPLRRRV